MRRQVKRHPRGFTLIELMIAAAVLVIIVSIALPSYLDSVRKTRRADARVALTTVAQRLERCYTQYGAYNDGNCNIANPQNSDEGFYQITIQPWTATTYTLTATPIGSQTSDTRCTTLVLDHLGQRTATGSHTDECW